MVNIKGGVMEEKIENHIDMREEGLKAEYLRLLKEGGLKDKKKITCPHCKKITCCDTVQHSEGNKESTICIRCLRDIHTGDKVL